MYALLENTDNQEELDSWHVFIQTFKKLKLKLEAWLMNSCISVELCRTFQMFTFSKTQIIFCQSSFPSIFQLMYVFREF